MENKPTRNVRTLHIIDRLDKRRGGSVYATLAVCKYLARAGQPVEAVGSIGSGDALDHLEHDFSEFKTHRFDRSFPVRYSNSAAFAAWLTQSVKNYDLVEVHAIFNAFAWRAAKICRKAGVPYLIRPHGSLDPFDLQKHAALKKILGPFLVRPMLEGAKAMLLTAPMEADRVETYGARVRKLVLPLPVSLGTQHGNGSGFRHRYGIPRDAQVVLFMSRVDYKKGLEFLIPALGVLKAEFPKLWFVMAGSGEPEFVGRVKQLLIDHRVQPFTSGVGFVTGADKADAMAAANLFALPSRNENFGIVNIEAMHMGLPLLVSNEVYIYQEIQQAGAGLICVPTTHSVTEQLRKMLNGSLDLVAMGRNGRELVEKRYRSEIATAALVKTYEEILGWPLCD